VRQIYPVHGPEFQPLPKARPGPLPAVVRELACLYGNEAAADSADGKPPAWLRANMVSSVDGAAWLNGRSGGLSGPADRMVFTVLRSLTDLILVGAGTASTEHYRPAQAGGLWAELRPPGAPVPAIAVVSARLHLDPDGQLLAGAAAGAQTIVITAESAPADRKAAIARHARIIEAGQQRVDIVAAIAELHRIGYSNMLTEGGPTLLGEIANAGLLDELCLTTSPVLAAGPASRIVNAPTSATDGTTSRLSLRHVLADESFLFSRYVREH
jgi:riboflavin biosynthesis pyrimidine reductase